MKQYKITRKKTYEKNGEEKTLWLDCGRMVEFDDGNKTMEWNDRDEKYYIFPIERKQPPKNDIRTDVSVENIPF